MWVPVCNYFIIFVVIHVINQPTDNNNSNIYNDNNDVTLSPTFIHTKIIEEQRPTSSTGDSDFDGHISSTSTGMDSAIADIQIF